MSLTVSNEHFINPNYKPLVYLAGAATVLAGASVFTPWESARIVGATTLTGIFYATMNDMIACRDCIEYFTVGHVYDGRRLDKRPIMTLDPNWNAIAWGMIASWHVSALAGVFFAAVARIPYASFTVKLTAKQILPYLGGGAIALIGTAHLLTRLAEPWLEKAAKEKRFVHIWPEAPIGMQARFAAVDVRNSVGYGGLAILAILLAYLMMRARMGFWQNLFTL